VKVDQVSLDEAPVQGLNVIVVVHVVIVPIYENLQNKGVEFFATPHLINLP